MTEESFSAIIEKSFLEDFANTITAEATGMEGPLVRECRLHISEENIRVRVVDAANVAMINPGVLDKRAFESFTVSGELTIGISLTRLLDMIDPAGSDSLVQLEFDSDTRRLLIRYDNADVQMGLIDPDSIRGEPDKPELDLPNQVLLEGSQLSDALEISNIIGDHVTVSVDQSDESISFGTKADIDEGSVTYSKADVIETDYTDTTDSLFSLNYLRTLAKPIPDAAEVTLCMGNEFPLLLSWSSLDGHFSVEQMLAPRIQSD